MKKLVFAIFSYFITVVFCFHRVGDVTGLNMETSEELQVANYGMGGHYEPHFDFARVSSPNRKRDRTIS